MHISNYYNNYLYTYFYAIFNKFIIPPICNRILENYHLLIMLNL